MGFPHTPFLTVIANIPLYRQSRKKEMRMHLLFVHMRFDEFGQNIEITIDIAELHGK